MSKEVSKFKQKSRRLRERMRLALPARVYGREGGNSEWTEMTRLIDVTPFGARFRLSRAVDIGRLLQLTLAMPRQLRVFDHAEDQYRVWSIVRNVHLVEQKTRKDGLVEVGVAFIGKRPPASFDEDPTRRYAVAQTKLESQLWAANEDSVEQLEEMDAEDKRIETRQPIPYDVKMEVLDAGQIVKTEDTVTENISSKGATVFTVLDVAPGTFIKLRSERHNALVLAVVRSRQIGADGVPRLHLEFIGSEWPL